MFRSTKEKSESLSDEEMKNKILQVENEIT